MSGLKPVYDFIDRLNRDRVLLERFERDPAAALEESGLSDEHRAVLLEGSLERLTELGMPALVRMRFLVARNPDLKQHVSLKDYFAELEGPRQ